MHIRRCIFLRIFSAVVITCMTQIPKRDDFDTYEIILSILDPEKRSRSDYERLHIQDLTNENATRGTYTTPIL